MNALNGLDKVALLLKHFDPKTADLVLNKLGAENEARVRARMQQLEAGPEQRDFVRQLVRELVSNSETTQTAKPADNPQPAPKLNIVIANDEPSLHEDEMPADPLEATKCLPPDRLAQALNGESPRTISLVLNLLDDSHAAEVFKRLSSDSRREASLHFTNLTMPPIEVLRRIAQGILQKVETLSQRLPTPDPDDQIRKIAGLIRVLDRDQRVEMLTALEGKDAAIAQKVKDLLYQFEDLLRTEKGSVQKLLAEIDNKTLATALRGATPAIQHKILTNLSKRAQDSLHEEMEFLGNVPKARVEEARQAIADVIRKLDERGELVMEE